MAVRTLYNVNCGIFVYEPKHKSMIEGDKLIQLMGYSIAHPDLIQIFEDLKLKKDFDFGTADFLMRSYKSQLNNDDGFEVYAKSINRKDFLRKYGKEQFATNPKGNEQIFFEFSLNHNDNLELSKRISLPFNLQYGDDSETIIEKIGQKPNEKFSYAKIYTDERHKEKNGYWFVLENFRILVALDAEFRLVWMRCTYLELEERKARELKKQLKQENKNIKPENKELILSSMNRLPTAQWRIRMADGDNMFTTQAIDDIENELKIFIERLATATEKKNATTILGSIKKVVLAINKQNMKHNNVVETMEREELCLFILELTKTAGFFAESEIDFTEEWREW